MDTRCCPTTRTARYNNYIYGCTGVGGMGPRVLLRNLRHCAGQHLMIEAVKRLLFVSTAHSHARNYGRNMLYGFFSVNDTK